MDWLRQAPGLCHACTKLSHSHSFIKIKHNLQWSWQLSSQVTNQAVMVGQTKWILPCSLSKAGEKQCWMEGGAGAVAWGTLAHSTFKMMWAEGREHPKLFAALFLHPICSWMGTGGKHNCCMLHLCQPHITNEGLNQHLEWHTEADQS